jgi:hypothetical protein
LVVFGDQVTKILHDSLFTFFTEQGKTGKNETHGNENLATYFWYFGSFDEKRTYKNMFLFDGRKSRGFLQRQKVIVIYYVKKFVKESQ